MHKASLIKAMKFNGIVPGSPQRKAIAFGVKNMLDVMINVYNHAHHSAEQGQFEIYNAKLRQ